MKVQQHWLILTAREIPAFKLQPVFGLGVRDFYALIEHGAWVTAVGTSDTHHLNGVLDGVARTYVLYDDPRAATVAGTASKTTCRAIRSSMAAADRPSSSASTLRVS